jgi:hypothetical protein
VWIIIYEPWGMYMNGDWTDPEEEEFPVVFYNYSMAESVANSLQDKKIVCTARVEECPK